jgi:predicted DNA-binding transcriptional regulator YafY
MSRSGRLFEIIHILRSANAPIPAHAIADALEVTKRTIYRDIVTLQAMRVPIEGEAGVGYIMRAGFDLPPLMFTPDEVEAIVVGLSLLGRTGDVDLQASAFRVIQKIASVLPDTADGRLDGSPLHVSHWNAIPPAEVDYRVMRQAIREERKLQLRYQDAEARSTERTVLPIALVYYVDSVILAAWCELRGDFRHFRMDRIKVCQPTVDVFKDEGEPLRAAWRMQHALFSA